MECDLCTEHFDGAERERLPKFLQCGHTACLQCLRRLPDSRCPTCRRDFKGPPEELPTNFLALKLPEKGSSNRGCGCSCGCWCSDCRTAATPATPRCWEDHDVLSVRSALRRHLQGALPQAAEQLQGLQGQCRDEHALSALTLLTGESWDVSLRGGGRELTGTLRNSEEPLTKALWLLLAARAALTEDRAAEWNPPPAAGPSAAAPPAPPAESRPPREMDVRHVSYGLPDDDALQEQADDLLLDAPGVTRLVEVYCHKDPAWSLELLQRAAPSVEQLSVNNPGEAHLYAVHAMPRLRRLYLWCDDGALNVQPPVLPALPPGHAGLQYLRVWRLPRATTQSLLRAHGESLETLQLDVGTAKNGVWPDSNGDLHSLLGRCRLRALRRLLLCRPRNGQGRFGHVVECGRQLAQVGRVLPGVEVLCDQCHDVPVEDL